MLKIGVSMRHRLLSLLLALVSLAIVGLIYVDNWKSRQTCDFPILNRDVVVGQVIKKEDLKWVEVGGYHLSQLNLALSEKQIIGRYAGRTLRQGEPIFLKDLLEKTPPIEVKAKLVSGALTVATDYERCVGGLPKVGDWVSVKVLLKDSTGTGVMPTPELQHIKVIAVQDKNGKPYDGKRESIGSEPALVTFDADPAQQELLLRGQYSGHLHLVLLPQR